MTEITFDTIKQYFDMPILDACRKMNISSTYLKRVCRKLHIYRWPYRKICFLRQKFYHAQNQYNLTSNTHWKKEMIKYQDSIASFYNLETFYNNNGNSNNKYEKHELYYSIISPNLESNTMKVENSDFGFMDEINSDKITFVDYSPCPKEIINCKNELFLKLDVDEVVKILSLMNKQ
jgi:hypothetical protein